ncbi:hypothetical protein [Butyrivibrio sp. VCB2006]|uniref:hypothetical protein n=1 Tax=Butyrivibrio sp. VCB2006 TaxID=1280679 RepID=UPI0003FA20EF|nr:hypothetical protein [Butyrivibrio sp. VCB2006]
MEQQKLFYNICNDLWAFSKTMDKPKDKMTDDDWATAISLMESTAEKYKKLGEKEYALAYSSMMNILDYVERA